MINKDKRLLESLVSKYGQSYIRKQINEHADRTYTYNVAFTDFTDEEGLPLSVKCTVDGRYKRLFERMLRNAQHDYVYNANGLDNDFELE